MPRYQYDSRQYTDMVLAYGRAYGDSEEALRMYLDEFGHRNDQHVPAAGRVIMRLVQRLRDHSSFTSTNVDTGISIRDNLRDQILSHFDEHPEDSTRSAGRQMDVSHSTVHNLLHEDLRHPFKLTTVHALEPQDFENRMYYCRWLLEKLDEDANFINNILWTDESTFQRDGMFNRRNTQLWSRENPRAFRSSAHQHRWTINVWAGILGYRILGPVFLPACLTGDAYREFLLNELAEMLDELPLTLRQRMWFQHDGAPAHHSRIVREVIDGEFGERWIGRGGPHAWPDRSPDLTPLDFFLWGYIKDQVFATTSHSQRTCVKKLLPRSRK